MTSPSTQSRPLRERLLPQASIRFFLFLIGTSALVMVTFRAAFIGQQLWAKIASLLITTAGGCFIVYALLFFVARALAATADPIWRAVESSTGGREDPAGGSRSNAGEA